MKNSLHSNLKLLFLLTAYSFFPNVSLSASHCGEIVCQGQTGVVYSVPEIINATGYIWTLPAGATITAGANTNSITVDFSATAVSGTITVQGSNSCGSGISSNFSVVVNNCEDTDFFIPEGFSPNHDGINDVLVIRGIENYPENSIVIFSRWGDKVFEANPYQNTWDGQCTKGLRIAGNELPVSTYFYLLNLGNGSKMIKGTIYLNR